MSQKVLYLGDNSWCYTVNCKRHGESIQIQEEYRSSLLSGDASRIEQLEAVMLSRPETKNAILRHKVQELKKKLGRTPAVGLDLDGTVADFTHGLRKHMGTKYRIPKAEWRERYPDPDEYEYSEGKNAWFNSRDEFMEEFLEAEKAGLYRNLRLIDSPTSTLTQLKGYGFQIVGTTARSDIYNRDSLHWLRTRRIPVERVIHTGPRKSHIKEVDLFIEDSPKVLQELFENNRPSIVKTQDYNSEMELPEGLARRIHNWDENTTPEEVVDLAFRTARKHP